ncbi:MAG: serine/threonine-protein kinase, partial [Baekduiaceae bacterium]
MTLRDGSTIGGYRVVRELGRGAASVVVEAVPPDGGAAVAVKVGLPGAVGADELRGRLLRGARAQERLDDPGIVRVLATGHDDALGPYVVMELVDGRPLSGLLRAGELPADRALDLLGQAASALDHAHAAGVRHRDVKPSNILVDADLRRARLADFGLARDAADAALTTTQGLAGTLQYLAPEVIRGGEPDAAADRYAFAATLYEALVGEPVFVRPTDAAVLFAHAQEEPEAPSARRPELGEAADAPLLWALAKDPGARPATSAELVAEVRDALGDHAAALPSPPAAIGPAPQAATVDVPVPTPPRARGLRPGAWLAIGVVAGIVLPVVVLILVTLGGGDDAAPAGDDAAPAARAGLEVLGA